MNERDFQSELYGLVCDILRTHRNRAPETQDEAVAASQKVVLIADILMPQIQELIAAGVTAVNTEQ